MASGGNPVAWLGSWRSQKEHVCLTLFLVARTPASWGLHRHRVQPWGNRLGRELGRETDLSLL